MNLNPIRVHAKFAETLRWIAKDVKLALTESAFSYESNSSSVSIGI